MLQSGFDSEREGPRIWICLGVREIFPEDVLFELGVKEWGLLNWVKGYGAGEEINGGGGGRQHVQKSWGRKELGAFGELEVGWNWTIVFYLMPKG